jgi:hypothetical protein
LLEASPTAAADLASILVDRPSSDVVRSLQQIEPVLNAVSALVDAGDFQGAHGLYVARLVARVSLNRYWRILASSGAQDVFLNIPALRPGLAASLEFVADRGRRQQCVEQLGKSEFAFYLGQVFLYAIRLSEFSQAHEFCDFAIEMARKDSANRVLFDCLIGKASLCLILTFPK